jgi:hypothetical protein
MSESVLNSDALGKNGRQLAESIFHQKRNVTSNAG